MFQCGSFAVRSTMGRVRNQARPPRRDCQTKNGDDSVILSRRRAQWAEVIRIVMNCAGVVVRGCARDTHLPRRRKPNSTGVSRERQRGDGSLAVLWLAFE